jgi:transposase
MLNFLETEQRTFLRLMEVAGVKVLGELESCLIGIEASTGAFFWQRQFEKLGHVVKIMVPQYVKQ